MILVYFFWSKNPEDEEDKNNINHVGGMGKQVRELNLNESH